MLPPDGHTLFHRRGADALSRPLIRLLCLVVLVVDARLTVEKAAFFDGTTALLPLLTVPDVIVTADTVRVRCR